jgi:hypothetical protein
MYCTDIQVEEKAELALLVVPVIPIASSASASDVIGQRRAPRAVAGPVGGAARRVGHQGDGGRPHEGAHPRRVEPVEVAPHRKSMSEGTSLSARMPVRHAEPCWRMGPEASVKLPSVDRTASPWFAEASTLNAGRRRPPHRGWFPASRRSSRWPRWPGPRSERVERLRCRPLWDPILWDLRIA